MKAEFPPQHGKVENEEGNSQSNIDQEDKTLKPEAKITVSSPFDEVRAEKRKSNEGVITSSKKPKFQHSEKYEKPIPCNHSSNFEKDDENQEETSSFMFSCYYCDDPNKWSKHLRKIFEHWAICHSKNPVFPFLFHIIYEFDGSFNFFKLNTLTNVQLERVLSIENPLNDYLSNSAIGKEGKIGIHVEYLVCGKCGAKLTEIEYLKHIEMHTHEMEAKKGENGLKTSLKAIYSKTKVIFSNCLALTKHNLSTTALGDSDVFDDFIDTLLNDQAKTDDAGPSSPTTEIVPSDTMNPQKTKKSVSFSNQNDKSEKENFPVQDSMKIASNDDTSSTTSALNSSNELLTELKLQRQRMHALFIFGVPRKVNELLEEIFAIICMRLKVSIDLKFDISRIFRVAEKGIIVELTSIEKKEEILGCDRVNSLFLHHILEVVAENRSTRLVLKDSTTHFYARIYDHLSSAMQRGRIHSFKLTKDGFAFRRAPNDDVKTILSVEQFQQIMKEKK